MDQLEKNKRISETQKQTKEKRKSQVCRVYSVKIDESRLSHKKAEHLKMLFVESKWFYNQLLSYENIFEVNPLLIKSVTHFDKDKNKIESDLKFITSSMKQRNL